MAQFYLTKVGIAELKEELRELIARRGTLADRLRAARDFGDLSENAEYDAARDEQGQVESRIAEIEGILRTARLIKKPKKDGKVQLGSKVRLQNDGNERQFLIVGTVEADPLNGKISDESPIGRALLGREEGETIEVELISRTIVYQIMAVD